MERFDFLPMILDAAFETTDFADFTDFSKAMLL